jgi:hypothetical protein
MSDGLENDESSMSDQLFLQKKNHHMDHLLTGNGLANL